MAQKIARWGTEFVVGTGPAVGTPSVAALGVTGSLTGRFVIVYAQGTTDTAGVGDTEGIVAQLYKSDGTPKGDPFLVNSTTSQIQIAPVVVDRVNDEGFAVAWKDFSSYPNGDGTAVRMRLFDVNGNPSGNDFLVHDDSQDFINQAEPSIARIGTTGTIFVGFDTSSSPSGEGDLATGVRGRTYSNATPEQGSDFAITNADPHAGENDFQAQVHVTDLPSTGFLATWVDNLESGVVFGTGTHIRGRLYNQTGADIGTEFTIASNANAVLNNVAAVGLQEDGVFVVAWTRDDDPTSGGFERNIYARIFEEGTGGTVFRLHASKTGQQDNVALAAYGPDKFVATWTSQDGPLVEIRARVFNSDGTAFSKEIVVNSQEDHSESLPSVAVLHEATGPRFVISWRDNTSAEIQAQIFDLTAGAHDIDFFGSDRGETYAAQYNERVLHGNGGKDTLTGSDQNDTIDGGTGLDTMRGGLGSDTYFVDRANDVIEEAGDAGTDTVNSKVGFVLSQNVERLVLGGNGDIDGTGNSLKNRITGNAGDNLLDGKGGADRMEGKAGKDTYVVNHTSDVVVEAQNAGSDTVRSSISYTLPANVEKLVLTGAADIDGVGNELDNQITGNSGENIINGKGGDDILTGGGGKDFFRFNTALGANNVDTVTDFKVDVDKIQLADTIFSAIGASLTAGEFVANANGTASNGAQHILYNTTNGRLFYDADGSGGQAKVHFATLSAGLALDHLDFLVI